MYIYLSVYLYQYPSIYLSIYLSIYAYEYMNIPVYQSIYLSINPIYIYKASVKKAKDFYSINVFLKLFFI